MQDKNDDLEELIQPSNLLALLVDDSEKALREKSQLLEQAGFRVIRAKDEVSAQREFAASPTISFAMVDINLHAERAEDKSGVLVARRLRATLPDLPIVGYSAAFAEDALSEEDYGPFSEAHGRGRLNASQLLENITRWIDDANRFWEGRKADARLKLNVLKEQYPRGTSIDFELVRMLTPERASPDSDGKANVERSLREAGYRLRVVDAGQTRPTVSGDMVVVPRPLWIWTKDCEDHAVAEIYGYPELYSVADNEAEAIEGLLVLMDGLLVDLSDDDSSNSARLNEVAAFLRQTLI
ncbi:response regulator [Ideonella alba]|uniref:Response regulator n=1 Tax=Ideonella alba TaxID=2824118 RepID=A0A940YGL3_9BURK|nr:response regulator [Ideonella alba]MBQ0932112.1 response regulator [Ideonella alba]